MVRSAKRVSNHEAVHFSSFKLHAKAFPSG